ncbi:hypothetical protein [Anaerosporobacter sp.]|uniref:hypothetical protein n=1 Tax=Anaerosporobacter sp. TaxID=1872529 RepID=UPI00286F35CE|nr:hypothetical protein [Anaerosporobacter sp.]
MQSCVKWQSNAKIEYWKKGSIMTKEQAKQNLIAFGIAEPTDEMVTNYLSQLDGEIKPFKEKAKTVDTLQQQLDDINEKGLTDLEKANKAIETSNETIANLTKQVNKSEVKAILSAAGLTEDDYKDFIDGIVTDNLETSKSLATNLSAVLTKQRDSAEAKVREELLNATPSGNGNSSGAGDDKKTEAEKVAETLGKAMAGNATSKDVIGNYL